MALICVGAVSNLAFDFFLFLDFFNSIFFSRKYLSVFLSLAVSVSNLAFDIDFFLITFFVGYFFCCPHVSPRVFLSLAVYVPVRVCFCICVRQAGGQAHRLC